MMLMAANHGTLDTEESFLVMTLEFSRRSMSSLIHFRTFMRSIGTKWSQGRLGGPFAVNASGVVIPRNACYMCISRCGTTASARFGLVLWLQRSGGAAIIDDILHTSRKPTDCGGSV